MSGHVAQVLQACRIWKPLILGAEVALRALSGGYVEEMDVYAIDSG